MAIVGQCKACYQVVSDEALSCPHCGQPSPCLLAPPVGSVQDGHVESVLRSEWGDSFGIMLSSGVRGVLLLASLSNRIQVGDAIKVKVKEVDKGRHNAVTFSLE